jgi:hypothetical protein
MPSDEREVVGRRVAGQVMIRFDWCNPMFGRTLPRPLRGTESQVVQVDLKIDEDLQLPGCEIAHPWTDPIGPVRSVWFQLRSPDLAF